MSSRAQELSQRFTAFHDELVSFVESCSEQDWSKVSSGEGWSVGVVVHHVTTSHYGTLDWVKMIVGGHSLPDVTMEAVHQVNAQHAQKHADCTRDEALALLREQGAAIADYVAGLSDADLDRTTHLAMTGGDISAQGFVEAIIIASGSAHLANAQATVID